MRWSPLSHLSRKDLEHAAAATLALFACIVGIVIIFSGLRPHIIGATYRVGANQPVNFQPPLYFQAGGNSIILSLQLSVPETSRANTFDVFADDCLQLASLDQKRIDSFQAFCGETRRFSIDLSPGQHTLEFVLSDHGGAAGFDFAVAKTDRTTIGMWALILFACSLYVFALLEMKIVRMHQLVFPGAVLFPILLRILYTFSTPFFVRSHEWDKHVDYIRYVAEHLRIPPAAAGWEFHQHPLYYIMTGAYWRVMEFFGFRSETILLDLRTFSLLIGIASVLAIAAIARDLFQHRREQILFLLLASLLPRFVFMSSQITNDGLLTALSLWSVYFLFRAMRTRTLGAWSTASAFLGFALLTKLNAVFLLPVMALGFLTSMGTFRPSMKVAGKCCGIVLVLFLWLPALRFTVEHDLSRTVTIGNKDMDPGAKITPSIHNLFAFHPLRVLRRPYAEPMGTSPEKDMFLEYFFRSAFFGEFGFPSLYLTMNVCILFLGMCLTLFMIGGMLREYSGHTSSSGMVMAVLTLSLLAGAIAYRTLFPYAPNQDFRFSMLLVVPSAYYVLRSYQIPSPPLRRLCASLAYSLMTFETLLIITIVFTAVTNG